MVNSPLIRPAISWGGSGPGGGTLDSHDKKSLEFQRPITENIGFYLRTMMGFITS